MSIKRPMRFAMFSDFSPSGAPPNLWHNKHALEFDYLNLNHWIKLAQDLEEAKFDCFFWADHTGLHDTYRGSKDPTLELAVQFPIADPVLLAAALAASTKDIGFAMSANVIQYHPYIFARKMATLDHLTNGRVGWNVVTSFQKSAWQNEGFNNVEPHAVRYERAEEYLQVVYKLLEGSWDDDAVVRDVERRIYADPSKVHEIHHKGEFYSVPGICTVPPSPQRTPVLFQAGSSEDGRTFSAKNAEAIFIVGTSIDNMGSIRRVVDDMGKRLIANGRRPNDMHILCGRAYVIGSTEEEAQRMSREIQEIHDSSDYGVAYMSSVMGIDLSAIDIDKAIGDFETDAIQGPFKALAQAAPNRSGTFRDVANYLAGNRFVGTPDQAAEEVEQWLEAGVTGINYQQMTGAGEVYSFIEHVCPVLKERGLMQTEYAPGTFREKLFHDRGESASGPHLNERHPAAQYRNLSG